MSVLRFLQNEFIILDVSRDESTSLTTGTGKYYFKIPFLLLDLWGG